MRDRKTDRKSERKVRGTIVTMNKIIFELKILDKICKRYINMKYQYFDHEQLQA